MNYRELIDIPKIVKDYVMKYGKRMPETQEEVDTYLDLMNHAKEYSESVLIKSKIGTKMMKRLGLKTPEEIKKEGQRIFHNQQ